MDTEGNMFDISVVFPISPAIGGVLSTLAVSLSAIVIGLILGWLICLGLNSPRRLVRCFCKTYVSFIVERRYWSS